MTVLQIVKALAGEEDINWGDSDTTFARQTRTGSSTNIHYIDDKSIPANSLGGVVEDHLHTQNTDTGTTSSSFIIDSDSDSATLDTAGLTASRTFTLPNTQTTQALVGLTDLAATGVAAASGAKTVGVYDTAGNYAGSNVESVLAEIATNVDAIPLSLGYKRGFGLVFLNTSVLSLTQGMWHHSGTTAQMVYSAGALSFSLAGLSGTQLQYIYLDDSAIVSAGSAVIEAGQLTNATDAPTWSNTKCGWYYGQDRCIGAVYVDGGVIIEFRVFSDTFYALKTAEVLYSEASAPTSATELDLSAIVPAYCTRASVAVQHATADDQVSFLPASGWAAKGQVAVSDTGEYTDVDICLDTDQTTLWSADTSSQTIIGLNGYYMGDL